MHAWLTWEVGEDEEGVVGLGGGEGEVLAGDGRAGLLQGEVEVHVLARGVCASSAVGSWFRVDPINVAALCTSNPKRARVHGRRT